MPSDDVEKLSVQVRESLKRKQPMLKSQALAPLLSNKLGAFVATEAAKDVSTANAKVPLREVARHYLNGDKDLYVKITDTTELPAMRESFAAQLDAVAKQPTDELRVIELKAQPTVLQFVAESHGARVLMLVANRFLVEARLRGASSVDEVIAGLRSFRFAMIRVRRRAGA